MRVKMIKAETAREAESEINNFLLDRRDVKIIDIKEIYSQQFYRFMVIYEEKDLGSLRLCEASDKAALPS